MQAIKLNKVRKFLDKDTRFIYFACHGMYNNMPDSEYVIHMYKARMHKTLNLENPKTFNEKLQWLKVYYHNQLYTTLVDKYAVKKYVAELIGEKYIITTLGVWKHFNDIDWDILPDQFILKCTHDSGGGIICKDKKHFKIMQARKKLENRLKINYYYYGREWPYKNVTPQIIAEKYMEQTDSGRQTGLDDYKFFCFNGVVDNIMVVKGRSLGEPKFYHFNKEWKLCRFNRLGRSLPEGFELPKPKCFDEMIMIAEKLSKGMPHVRVDLYEINGQVYFGEYTFFHESGFETGFDDSSDIYLGNLINLPEKIV